MRISFLKQLLKTLAFSLLFLLACTEPIDKNFKNFFEGHPEYAVDGYDFPVGKPNGKGYYNAQRFGKNNHLGDDWNGVNGGDSDFGDPIYAIGNGYVKAAYDHGLGWGKVIRIVHYQPGKNPEYIESLYAHCAELSVKKGEGIKKGQQIGTIGTANGRYKAHLHLEVRSLLNLGVGEGYSKNQEGYLNPTTFIKNNR